MLTALASEFVGYIVAALAAVAAVIGVYFQGRASGRSDEVAKRETQLNEQGEKAREKVRNVELEIARSGDAAVRERARKWVRK